MAAKREVPDADYLVQRYLAGDFIADLLKERGISRCCFDRILRDFGVKKRTQQESVAIRRGKPVPKRQWRPPDPQKAISDYIAGVSENELAKRYGISRLAISGFLTRNGVARRNQSEAERVKWAAIKSDRALVERQCARAWAAADAKDKALENEVRTLYSVAGLSISEIAGITGTTKTNVKRLVRKLGIVDSDRHRVARGFACGAKHAISSRYEAPIIAAMRSYGLEPVHQYALGSCNVDVAFPELRVAVEIERRTRCDSKSLRGKRIKNIFDRGWRLLVVYSPSKLPIDADAVAQQVASFLNLVRGNPSLPGEYGVISRDGKPFTARRFDLDGWTRIAGF